ncbi:MULTISPECIES: hypothetical protein [unclassified Agrobacterium]|uniref:hypothetical protein n=1 Tax=unclassified Agrobacterium TaxID=2632611 RepID=UPI00037CB8FD|nr:MULTISPECIES: hypothetical protein [unclassified Agrobacterium]SNB61983.1 hypothetical protein SAMN05661103_1838 [Agrobacterium sp. 719_389]
MDLPVIAYVDESADERDNFFGDAYDSGLFSEIHLLHPDDELNTLISRLVDLRIDALISDFNLGDAGQNAYTGAQVVEAFLEIRDDFPCFIRTSWDAAALKSSNDVNRVYSKNIKKENDVGRNLFERIALQVEHHRDRIDAWQNEFDELIAIEGSERSASQVERILELDGLLERHVEKSGSLPMSTKRAVLNKEGLFAREDELIRQAEQLIAAMKSKAGD